MKFHSNLKTVLISIFVLLLFVFSSVFIISELNLTSPTLLITNNLFAYFTEKDSDFTFTFSSLERNLRDRVKVNDILIKYKHEDLASIDSMEIKMGLLDLLSYIIRGKTSAEIVVENGNINISQALLDSFSKSDSSVSENDDKEESKIKYSFTIRGENLSLSILDRWNISGISTSFDIDENLNNLKADIRIPSIGLTYDDYDISLDSLLVSLNVEERINAAVSVASIGVESPLFSVAAGALESSFVLPDLDSIEDLEGSLRIKEASIGLENGEFKVNPITLSYKNKNAQLTVDSIDGYYRDIYVSTENATVEMDSFEYLKANVHKIKGSYLQHDFVLENINLSSLNLDEKKAEFAFQSFIVEDLENLTKDFISKVEVDDCSLSLDFSDKIDFNFGLNSIITPKKNVSEDIRIGFDINLVMDQKTIQSFSIKSRDMYLGYGEKKDNNLEINGNTEEIDLKLEYGKINLDFSLGLEDYRINGSLDLKDYPVSTIYDILPNETKNISSYIPSSASLSCNLKLDGSIVKDNTIPFTGDVSYLLSLSDLNVAGFTSYIDSKANLHFEEDGLSFSSLELGTKYFSLLLSGDLPYKNMLPSLSFSLTQTDGRETFKGSIILSNENTYDISLNALTIENTSFVGKVFFQDKLITGSSVLTTFGTERPFIFNVDLNTKTFGASSSKIGLTGTYDEKINASLILRNLDIVRDGKGSPMTMDGDLSLDIEDNKWSIKGEGINLDNLWFIPSSPSVTLSLWGDQEKISIPDLSISTNGTTYFTGKVYFDFNSFDLSGSLDAVKGQGDVIFSFNKNELYSGFVRARDLDLSPFGVKDMYADINLIGRASRLVDLSLEGKIDVLAYDSVNDSRKLTADISLNDDSLLLDNIKFSNSGLSVEIDSVDWNSLDGVLKVGEGRLRMKGEHADRDFPVSADFNLSFMLNNDENLYTSLYNILRDGGEGIELEINLKSLDIDNSRILVEDKSTVGFIKNRVIDFSGSFISGWLDFDAMTFDLHVAADPLADIAVKGSIKDGIDANAIINSFNMYFVNMFMNPPFITFDECFVKGEVGILEKDGIYSLNGNLSAEEMGINIFWVPDQKVIVHNPTFTLWNNDLRCSVSKATVIDYTTYERKTIDIYAGLTLTPTLSLDGYVAEMWMDEENTVRIRLPLPMMGIDILANGYGHYYMKTADGEAMKNEGELNVIDSVVTIGMNPYPEWYKLKGNANVDLILNFKRNNRVMYPAGNDPIISITLDEDSSVKFVKNGKDISVQGDVDIRGGEIFYFQKYFYITEGNISFPDPNKLDPKINLRATLRAYDSESNRVEVYLVMKDNTFENISPTLESSPAKDLNEIMEILGQSILPSSTYGTVSLGSVTQLVTEGLDILGRLGIVTTSNPISGVNQSLKEFFGVDSFSLHSNIVNNILSDTISNSLTDNYSSYSPMARYLDGTTLNIGKYLSSDFYLQGMVHLSANNNAKDKYTFISDDLVLDTEFSLEWMNPAFKITFTTSPSYFSLFSIFDTFKFSISKTINF